MVLVALPDPHLKVYPKEVRWGDHNRTRLVCWKGELHTYKRMRTKLITINNDDDVLVVRYREADLGL